MVLVTVRGILLYLVSHQASMVLEGRLMGMFQMLIELCIYLMGYTGLYGVAQCGKKHDIIHMDTGPDITILSRWY